MNGVGPLSGKITTADSAGHVTVRANPRAADQSGLSESEWFGLLPVLSHQLLFFDNTTELLTAEQ